jgi:hypothetical protein
MENTIKNLLQIEDLTNDFDFLCDMDENDLIALDDYELDENDLESFYIMG